jgi:hypothetical protein
MYRRVKNLLSFALAGTIGLTASGALYAQGTSTGSNTGTAGSSTSMAGGSFGLSSSSFGLSSAGTTGSTSSSPYGQSAGAGSRSTGIGSTSLFGAYYANPLSYGIAGTSNTNGNTSTSPAYGNVLYNTTSTNSSIYNVGTSGSSGSTGNRGSTGRTGTNSGTGTVRTGSTSSQAFGPMTTYRSSPSFITRLDFASQAPPPRAEVRADLQRLVAESPEIASRAGITVRMDGDTVVLSGQVRDNQERRLVGSMMLLAPGVRGVRNELVPTVTTED